VSTPTTLLRRATSLCGARRVRVDACVLACVFAFAASASPAAAREGFPLPDSLKPAVGFWKRVYLDVSTSGGLLHDSEYLGVVYEVVQYGERKGRASTAHKERRRRHWQDTLRRMSKGVAARNDAERAAVAGLKRALGRAPTSRDLAAAAGRIRFQLGQRDKFRDGLIRSGAYEAAMRDVFRRAGLPEDLAYLPHVESSFNIRAYSKYGAAGAWQFMRSTGALYMTVDYVVDERLDPMLATDAAARLLRDNYSALQSWPLALTAYNHGRGGMLRAKREHGDDIAQIVKRYKSRTFGFASRNFYAQFMAAREIMSDYQKYFGPVRRDEPEPIDEIQLGHYLDIADVEAYLGVPTSVVARYNPALRPPVLRSDKRIPKGYTLRLPAGTVSGETWLAALPPERRYDDQHRSQYYRVQRGDTLGQIARRNRTSVATLASLNNLRRKHTIFPGQVLQLPDGGGRKQPAPSRAPSLIRTAQAATKPRAVPIVPRAKPARAVVEEVAAAAEIVAPSAPAAALVGATSAAADIAPEAEVTNASDVTAVGEEAAGTVADATTEEAAAETPSVAAEVAEADAATSSSAARDVPGSPLRRVRGTTITVDALETLGHYADWLEIPTQRLRSLNRMRRGTALQLGQRVKVDFSRVSQATFEQRRDEYHKAVEEDFFGAFQVVSVVEHRVRPGDTMWRISKRTYDVPPWLIYRYNPAMSPTRLTPGMTLVIPVVEPL
jgi:membrane-bound lytic murein transglycosylase D